MFKFAGRERLVNLFCTEHFEPLILYCFKVDQTQPDTQNEAGNESDADFEAQPDSHDVHIESNNEEK